MFRSALALSILVFSLSMVVAAAIMPRPPVEPVAENRTALEVIEETVAKQN